MKEPKINEAHYTKLLKDCIWSLDAIFDLFHDDFTDIIEDETIRDIPDIDLYEAFRAKYNFYEINILDKDYDISEEETFYNCVRDTFRMHVNYYIQLANAYYLKFDFTTANKRRVHRTDSGTSETTGTSSSTGNTENDTYGLPNKQVNGLKDGYLTDVEKGTSSDSSESVRSGETSLESDIVTTFDNEYLEMKRQYVRQLRNLMLEFVDKFEDCFLHVYS